MHISQQTCNEVVAMCQTSSRARISLVANRYVDFYQYMQSPMLYMKNKAGKLLPVELCFFNNLAAAVSTRGELSTVCTKASPRMGHFASKGE
jgi:hypothetical protein